MRATSAIVPLKAIAAAKSRMAPTLDPEDRAILLERTFSVVMRALKGARQVGEVLVVAGDDIGASWAAAHGARVLYEAPGRSGLNGAIELADTVLGDRASIVVPADLPLVTAQDIDDVIEAADGSWGVVVAATADGGTGALYRFPGGIIAPEFGPQSAAAHVQAARKAGISVTLVNRPGLALDLDRPDDIERAGGWEVVTREHETP